MHFDVARRVTACQRQKAVEAPLQNQESVPTPNDLGTGGGMGNSIATTAFRPLRMRSLVGQLLQLLAVSAMAFACYLVISRFLLQSVTVMGVSMAPTLIDSERYLLNRWVYYVRAPQRN